MNDLSSIARSTRRPTQTGCTRPGSQPMAAIPTMQARVSAAGGGREAPRDAGIAPIAARSPRLNSQVHNRQARPRPPTARPELNLWRNTAEIVVTGSRRGQPSGLGAPGGGCSGRAVTSEEGMRLLLRDCGSEPRRPLGLKAQGGTRFRRPRGAPGPTPAPDDCHSGNKVVPRPPPRSSKAGVRCSHVRGRVRLSAARRSATTGWGLPVAPTPRSQRSNDPRPLTITVSERGSGSGRRSPGLA